MSGLQLDLSLGGDVQLSRRLMGISAAGMDFRPAFHEMEELVLAHNVKQFSSQGAAGSGGWQPLADSTMTMRTALGIGASSPILDRTGATYGGRKGGTLKRAATVKGDAGNTSVIAPHAWNWSINDPIASIHQGGKGNNPVRKILDLPETLRKALVKVAHVHWVNGRRG